MGPFAWLRHTLGTSAAGSVAIATVVVALSGAGIALLAALNAGGGAGFPPAATAPPAPAVTPTEVVEQDAPFDTSHLHTGTIDTGLAEVDAVAEEVLRGDVGALLDRYRSYDIECVEVGEAIGHPPLCEDDGPEGTPVEVYNVAGEIPWQRDPAPVLRESVSTSTGLYAAAHGPQVDPPGVDTPVAEYVLVFSRHVPGSGECGFSIDLRAATSSVSGRAADAASWTLSSAGTGNASPSFCRHPAVRPARE